MSKITDAITEIHSLETLSRGPGFVNRLHPLGKLLLTVFYIAVTVSFPKYSLPGLITMAVYPAAVFLVADLSFGEALRRLRVVLPLVCVVGILNPFFDRTPVLTIGTLAVSGGVLSMVTLMVKAVLTVLAGYLLIATTPIEEICRALRLLHLPKVFTVVVLLIYRYVTVLLAEARRITQAYSLRAPGQKGVAWKAWGPLLGQMLLRSMDRAEGVYDAMLLRGFTGEFAAGREAKLRPADILWPLVWMLILLALRLFPVTSWIGNLFV